MKGRWALSNPCAATLWFATAGLAEGNARAATVNAPAWPGTETDSGTNEPG